MSGRYRLHSGASNLKNLLQLLFTVATMPIKHLYIKQANIAQTKARKRTCFIMEHNEIFLHA